MSNRHVIVLEDHPLVRQAMVDQVSSHDCEVVYAGASAKAAIETTTSTKVDCIVMDLDLGAGHPEIASVAEVSATGVPVIIMTAFATPATVSAALTAGAQGFVSKEAETDEFLEAIDAAIAGEQFISSTLRNSGLLRSDRPQLSEQERRAIALYASGLKMAAVSQHMGVSLSTAQEYVKRARAKYAKAGRPAPTKTALYHVARQEGLLP